MCYGLQRKLGHLFALGQVFLQQQPPFHYWHASLRALIWEKVSDSHLLVRGRATSDGWHRDSAKDDRADSPGQTEVTDSLESSEELCRSGTIRVRVPGWRFCPPEGIPMEKGYPIQEIGQIGVSIHRSFQSDRQSG